jgi:hypothetical protein
MYLHKMVTTEYLNPSSNPSVILRRTQHIFKNVYNQYPLSVNLVSISMVGVVWGFNEPKIVVKLKTKCPL